MLSFISSVFKASVHRKKMKANKKHKEVEGNVSYLFGIIFIVVLGGLYGVVYAIDHTLPTPLEIKDEVEHPESFIAESARNFLRPLVDIGPRVTGHPNNEVLAVNYLREAIKGIINNAHTNQHITYDVNVHSGSFFLDFKPNGAINVYDNIQNVVVKIHSKNNSPHSVLINTHFDTVPNSPGGSDDGINVAIALEIIRKLSRESTRPTHNIIFLFNGAEEAALCGSHAFITKHALAKEARVFINLEATGAGGKEILFQTGPDEPWLLKYYDVPHPHANAAAEELFQSNIIPSDTDFRIFRDFGEIVGYDFAYYMNGYRYHTKYDGIDNIDLGSFQHTGDNILRLVKNLAEAPELANANTSDGKTVFFDVFGLFFIQYNMEINTICNSVLLAISFLLLIWACIIMELGNLIISFIYVTILVFGTLLGWIITYSAVLLLATILDVSNRSMSWYSVPALNFLLYVAPTSALMLLTTLILNKLIRHKTLTFFGKVLLQVHIVRLIWTVPLVAMTIMGLRIAIIGVFGVFFNCIGMLIIHALLIVKPKFAIKSWVIIYVVSTIIPTMILYLYAHQDIMLFTPILGRFGAGINPDLLMALFVSSFTIFIGSYYTPLFTYIQKPWNVIMVLATLCVAGIILAYTPVGFPYTFSETNPKLQRYSIYHTMRTIRDDQNNVLKSDSGFYFFKNDRNTPHSIEGEVSFLEKAVSLENDCKLVPGCGLPITNSRNIKNIEDSVWIPSASQPFDSSINYVLSKLEMSPTSRRYVVQVDGSDKIDIYLSIRKGYTLTKLSLVHKVPEKYIEWNDQVTYYISFVYGKYPTTLVFSFDIETASDWSLPAVDLAMTTKFVHDDLMTKTSEYQQFLDEFPEWTTAMVTGLAQYENVVLV